MVEDVPNSRIQIEMDDEENPIVKLVQIGCGTPKIVDHDEDGVFLRNIDPLTGKQVIEQVGMGLLNVFTFLTSFA